MGRKRLGEAEASRLRFDALAELLDNGRRELPIAATFPLTQVVTPTGNWLAAIPWANRTDPPPIEGVCPMSEAIVVTAEFRLKPDQVQDWLRLMLDHYGPACVVEHGMLRYWLHHEDDDEAHVLLYEQWADRADFEASLQAPWREAYLADTERMWARSREL
jgi:quinol monooxygenase YgiN